ncbi:Selenoprotein Pa [Vespula maculifrons]|uniref:Selenoprotein Pa n=1 Tax=Vespula maculifrons TaxID=7453 RepID=A0ABD2ASK0_VESMC
MDKNRDKPNKSNYIFKNVFISNIDEDSESCANIANNDLIDIFNSNSDNSGSLFTVQKHCKRLVVEDDIDDEALINYQLSV